MNEIPEVALRDGHCCQDLIGSLAVVVATRPKLVKLVATCGPLDFNDPQPAITVMLPEED